MLTVNRYIVSIPVSTMRQEKFITPFYLGDNKYFLGPLMRDLRKILKNHLKDANFKEMGEDLFVGIFVQRYAKREFVWSGRVRYVLTFEEAFIMYRYNKRYANIFEDEYSPFFVEPIYKDNNFIGYGLRSKLHAEDNRWIRDLTTVKDLRKYFEISGNQILLKDTRLRKYLFDLDVTAILDNVTISRDFFK